MLLPNTTLDFQNKVHHFSGLKIHLKTLFKRLRPNRRRFKFKISGYTQKNRNITCVVNNLKCQKLYNLKLLKQTNKKQRNSKRTS